MAVCAWGASSLGSTFPVDDKAGRITQRQPRSSESPQPQPIQDLPQSLTQGQWLSTWCLSSQHGSPPGGCLCCEGPVGLGASGQFCAAIRVTLCESHFLPAFFFLVSDSYLSFGLSPLNPAFSHFYRHYSQSTPRISTYSQCLLPGGSNRLTYLHNKGTGYSRCNCNSHQSWYYYYYYYYFPWLRKTCSPSDQANLEWQVQRMSVLSLTSNYQTEQILCIATMYCRSWLGAGERGLLNLKDLSFTNAHIHFNCSAHKGYRHTLRVCKAAQVSWGINEF